MSHLIETYALSCGAKIEKPYLYQSYFPVPIEKYITFQAQSKFDSKNYSYWQDVIDIVAPVLQEQGISIVQVGQGNENYYKQVIDLRGKTNIHQLGYVIEKATLHVGPDSFGVHLAAMYDVPIVGLYSIIQSSVAGPYFGNKSRQILFDTYTKGKTGKPSYAAQESPKTINLVKPEEIADAIFKLLNINTQSSFETVFIGERYSNVVIRELIPNCSTPLNNPELPIEIRMDLVHDEESLKFHLSYLQKAVVVLNKPMDINILNAFKPHIALIAYKVTENDNPEFVRLLIKNGHNLILLSSLPNDILNKKKINYYEHGRINPMPSPTSETITKLMATGDKLYYRSCKMVASNNKIYSSHATEKANIQLLKDSEYQEVIDSPEFWEDLNFCILAKKKSK